MFSKNLAQFIWVTRETRYYVLITVLKIRNLKSYWGTWTGSIYVFLIHFHASTTSRV